GGVETGWRPLAARSRRRTDAWFRPRARFPVMAVNSTFAASHVRIELRNGSGRPLIHEIAGGEFVIGSVPGCDLRLTGANLPALICVITRQADSVHARKLAATLPLLHNGQPFSSAELQSGDLLSLGPMTILVAIERAQTS